MKHPESQEETTTHHTITSTDFPRAVSNHMLALLIESLGKSVLP